MAKMMTLNVRVSGALGEFVAANVGEDGAYENVSEICPRPHPSRHVAGRALHRSARLRAELTHAFAAPDGAYQSLWTQMR